MPNFIEPDDLRYDERSRALIAVGRSAIAQENPQALRAYFSHDFQFHSPDGDLDFAGLESFFSHMRDAFNGYYCERYEIVSAGSLVGCRTEWAAHSPLSSSPPPSAQSSLTENGSR